jgi:hypothetical protein
MNEMGWQELENDEEEDDDESVDEDVDVSKLLGQQRAKHLRFGDDDDSDDEWGMDDEEVESALDKVKPPPNPIPCEALPQSRSFTNVKSGPGPGEPIRLLRGHDELSCQKPGAGGGADRAAGRQAEDDNAGHHGGGGGDACGGGGRATRRQRAAGAIVAT